MNFFKKIFNVKSKNDNSNDIIRITKDNISKWDNFEKLYINGEIKFDSKGRLRYLHGAPVGDLMLSRVNEDGTHIYREIATEWFDPESPKAKDFIWE